MQRARRPQCQKAQCRNAGIRTGQATLDSVLVLGVTALLGGLALYQSGRVLRAVYEFTCALISWPLM
ncbi:MAG: hypothetical protein EXS05_18795 [Planctomycetaceae bacterium]|nr:hypothetical protein [Planctomycetaceae bacterium]